ncbi:subtilisin-like serine protease QhpE [Paremcibacter congregatus]|uniref:Peptidase S8 and S53 subtilisin kexin sedolisin n=1 Tax=Paremcibacter congregatus TaxID=2043170 RepID=A0A2G4YQ69_9PROT|nr:S8 family serine peptidase [Paremcibacter congregatus]PHZ84455.1 peptidase S8 and S53 subtilisin kexin sedolisin [Paremcibacter congregatus]
MTRTGIRLGLVDSGLPPGFCRDEMPACRFVQDDTGAVQQTPVVPDPLGHGTTVSAILRHHGPEAMLYNAQVFDAKGVTTAATVAAAIDWLVAVQVDVINLSLGLQQDRTVLREACVRAVAADIILIASAPAQGAAVYPAQYPGVIRATGDARCAVAEISWLDSGQADFGACPRALDQARDDPPRIGGASLGAAHLSGQVAAYLQAGGTRERLWEDLVSRAQYVHSERRIK